MKRIFVCSPLSAPTKEGFLENQRKAEVYCAWVFRKGYRPFAPHLYYTRFLDDYDPIEREQGIQAGILDLKECEEVWAFLPIGKRFSKGMLAELAVAVNHSIPVHLYYVDDTGAVIADVPFDKGMLA